MLMTREMDYALRILRALYQGGHQSAAAVAERECMPKAITLKVLKQLHAAGLVVSRRGPAGGYLLAEGNRCQREGYQCENRPEGDCGLCRELSRIQEVLDGELRKTPLSAIFQEK